MTNTFLATLKSTSTTKDGPGSFEAVLSVPTLDRDDEVVDAKAFDPLPDHITIDIDHAMTVEKTVGSGRPFYDGDVLKFEGTYASTPLAQTVRTLVDEGHIRTMSVAFMKAVFEKDKKDGKNHLRKGELLNAGIVGIPSNREALITASKSLADTAVELAEAVDVKDTDNVIVKAGARHSAKDAAAIQTIHDTLAELGAACKQSAAEADETTDTEKAAAAAVATAAVAAVATTVAPAGQVEVAKARAITARAVLALLDN